MLEGSKIVLMGASVTIHMKLDHHVDTTKEVKFDLPMGTCIVSCHDMPLTMHKEHHLLVLDVKGSTSRKTTLTEKRLHMRQCWLQASY
jgi:hypothetical protein